MFNLIIFMFMYIFFCVLFYVFFMLVCVFLVWGVGKNKDGLNLFVDI